jgi:hypothetical protein
MFLFRLQPMASFFFFLVRLYNEACFSILVSPILRECSNYHALSLSLSLSLSKTKLQGLSPRANYTDRATAACRRSNYQLVRIEGATWSA